MYAPKRSLAAALTLPLLLALPACGDKKKDKDEAEKQDKAEEPPKVEKKELSTLFTGDEVTLPPPFAGLKLGMTLEEAKKAVPELPENDSIKPEEYPGIWFTPDFDDESKKLSRVYFNMPKAEAVKLMTAQWGEPKKGKDLDEEVLWWFNSEAGLRAALSDAFSDGEGHVEFTHYQPVEKFLGEGPELGFQKDAPLLGMTLAELEAKHGQYLIKKSEEDAAKAKEDIKKLAGEEAGAMMGKPTASVHLEYPPLEWGKYWTRVHPDWDDEGKLNRYWFDIEFKAHPEAKDEILALFKAKWGEPEEEEKYGKKLLVFSEEPFITVEEDTISPGWKVEVEPQRD